MATVTWKPLPRANNGGVDITECHSHRERDDSYSKVIIQPAPRWRIIECRNALQWIIQHRSSKLLNQGNWLGVSYLTSRNKLIEVSTGLNLLSDASMKDVLAGLPETISQRSSESPLKDNTKIRAMA
ncbi:hypothetical protein OAB39_03625 [Amylibacter sp.]|nr:hypothetical protein [Amylibacter sp.]